MQLLINGMMYFACKYMLYTIIRLWWDDKSWFFLSLSMSASFCLNIWYTWRCTHISLHIYFLSPSPGVICVGRLTHQLPRNKRATVLPTSLEHCSFNACNVISAHGHVMWSMQRYCHSRVHCSDAIMSAMASRITSLTIVYSTVHSGAHQRKYQSSASLAFVRGIQWWPVNSPHKGPVTPKMFPWCNHHDIRTQADRDISGPNLLSSFVHQSSLLIYWSICFIW